MKNNFKGLMAAVAVAAVFSVGCKKTDYALGDLTPPSNVVITTEVVGKDASHPNGDSTGRVNIKVSSDYSLNYKIKYEATGDVESVPTGSTMHKYTSSGLNTYTITASAIGKGGVATTATTTVTVYTKFEPTAEMVTFVTNDASKTWKVDNLVSGHFGVGPYNNGSVRPEWYAAGPNEKAGEPCFYGSSFIFSKSGTNFTLQSVTPLGAFTKTGSLTTLPGIPASGGETCYPYAGGTSQFKFVPASSGISATASGANLASTQVAILLSGNNTFIAYGAVQKEYEILSVTATKMHLRVRGTETGNAWYIMLKAQ